MIGGIFQSKGKLTQGLGILSGWLSYGVLVAPEEGQFGFGLSIQLP